MSRCLVFPLRPTNSFHDAWFDFWSHRSAQSVAHLLEGPSSDGTRAIEHLDLFVALEFVDRALYGLWLRVSALHWQFVMIRMDSYYNDNWQDLVGISISWIGLWLFFSWA